MINWKCQKEKQTKNVKLSDFSLGAFAKQIRILFGSIRACPTKLYTWRKIYVTCIQIVWHFIWFSRIKWKL